MSEEPECRPLVRVMSQQGYVKKRNHLVDIGNGILDKGEADVCDLKSQHGVLRHVAENSGKETSSLRIGAATSAVLSD